MASSAISAQGSILQVNNSTGTAKNVSGLALGFPTIVTASAHGFANGDVVTFASLGGNTTLNGQTVVIKNVTNNTFAVDVDTTGGSSWTSGGTATPATWTQVKNLKSFSGFDGSASELDKTNLDSTAKEIGMGLIDNGNFTVEIDVDRADAGQAALRSAQVAGAIKTFKLTLPNSKTATFTGYVKKFSEQGGVDAIVKGSVDLRISGAVTFA